MEKVEINKEDLQKLVGYFKDMCGYAEELNIYEWEDADKDMQEMQEWVSKTFQKEIK
jgi:hypothetical protein